jgi:hypothetical protein
MFIALAYPITIREVMVRDCITAKDNPVGKQGYNSILPLPQTVAQTTTYNSSDDYITRRNTFMSDVNMHPEDESRSSVVVQGRDEDYILTASSYTEGGPVYLHETTGKL